MRVAFHQTRNQIAWCFVQSRLLVWITKIDLHDEYLASITVKYDSSAPCDSVRSDECKAVCWAMKCNVIPKENPAVRNAN